MDKIVEPEKILSDEECVILVDALRAICNKVCWKPGKDILLISKNAGV